MTPSRLPRVPKLNRDEKKITSRTPPWLTGLILETSVAYCTKRLDKTVHIPPPIIDFGRTSKRTRACVSVALEAKRRGKLRATWGSYCFAVPERHRKSNEYDEPALLDRPSTQLFPILWKYERSFFVKSLLCTCHKLSWSESFKKSEFRKKISIQEVEKRKCATHFCRQRLTSSCCSLFLQKTEQPKLIRIILKKPCEMVIVPQKSYFCKQRET